MPLEYAGGGVVASTPPYARPWGSSTSSHLGKARVRGPGAAAYVNAASPTTSAGSARARRSTRCAATTTGGVVDDLIAYLRGEDEVFLVPNAPTPLRCEALAGGRPAGVEVVDQHTAYAVLAVQGPRSAEVLDALGLPPTWPTWRSSTPGGRRPG